MEDYTSNQRWTRTIIQNSCLVTRAIAAYYWILVTRVYFRQSPVWQVRGTNSLSLSIIGALFREWQQKKILSLRDVDSKWLLTVCPVKERELKFSLPLPPPFRTQFVDLRIAILTYTSRSSAFRSSAEGTVYTLAKDWRSRPSVLFLAGKTRPSVLFLAEKTRLRQRDETGRASVCSEFCKENPHGHKNIVRIINPIDHSLSNVASAY